ncbi:cobalamin-dependent protein [Sphingomonas sp.]|uniref:B12-binding domain-containing radical SAM protein n=1 Tax=Sphingomonas sp. TaxID=28214 RepID=UPI0031D30337
MTLTARKRTAPRSNYRRHPLRILLVNIPHPAIGSRIPREQLPPLGLLSVGGPLIGDGHAVELLDAEFGPMPLPTLVAEIVRRAPDAVLFGHSGSSSAQPIISRIAADAAAALPDVRIVYGGVHPTYFWREILRDEPYVDAIVRGEGEETTRRLMRALDKGLPLDDFPGIAFRRDGAPFGTPPAPVITDLDAYRVGRELIDHRRYSYWGGKRATPTRSRRSTSRRIAGRPTTGSPPIAR